MKKTKKTDKKSSKKKSEKKENSFKKTLIATSIIICIVAFSFAALFILFPPGSKNIKVIKTAENKVSIDNKKPSIGKKKNLPAPEKEKKKKKEPVFEIYPDHSTEKNIIHKEKKYSGKPKICIIIDDIGYDYKAAKSLAKLGVPITLSVIPFTPHGKKIYDKIKYKNVEYMLHVPMQPREYPKVDPGKGALLIDMTPDKLIYTLENDLKWLPGIKGINNHMGSRLTEDSDKMNQVFTILKKKNLFFIDSLTSPESRCMESARLFQLDFAKRDVFLDHKQDEKFILGQIELLRKTALKKGLAIGIGHPYPTTIKALKKTIKKLKKEVVFVKASSIVKKIH